jgi:uncharacterized membrane protein
VNAARARAVLAGALILAWLLGTHWAATSSDPRSALLPPLVLISLLLLPGLCHGQRRSWLLWLLLTLALLALLPLHLAALPMELLPVLLPALAASVFGASLRRGREPLVMRFVRISEGAAAPTDAATFRYTRAVTAAWTLLLAAMAVIALLLIAFAVPDGLLAMAGAASRWSLPRAWWGLWSSAIAYAVLGAAFVLEYTLRRWLLPQAPRHGFVAFARALAVHWPELKKRA